MKKILVTGCYGLLGQSLVKTLHGSYDVIASAKTEKRQIRLAGGRFKQLDIANAADCKTLVRDEKPDIIINAAAYTNVDGCEDQREECWKVNVKGVENLALAARSNMALLVQISTDYIFGGSDGPYGEADRPNPPGYYGKSKLAAENCVRMAGIPYAILRTNVLYGCGIEVKNNFFLWVYHSLKAGKAIRVVTDQFNNPTLVDEMAEGIHRLIAASCYGVYHLGGRDYLNRHDFALNIAEVFGFSKSLISPVTTADLNQKAPRPMRGGLKIDLAQKDFGYEPRPVITALEYLKSNSFAGQE